MNELVEINQRDTKGRFLRGVSGNVSGRPKDAHCVSVLAKQHTDLALRTLAEIAGNRKATPSARVAASEALLNRAWGKPPASVSVENTQVSYTDFLLRIGREQRELPECKRLTTLQEIDNTEKLVEETKQYSEWE